VYSHQNWFDVQLSSSKKLPNVRVAICARCGHFSIWHSDNTTFNSEMIFPVGASTAPLAHPDLFSDARKDYEEARSIANRSPRGAAALLRLVIQKVCKELGESGKDLNADIGNLVKKGLPPTVKKALDVVRVIGNHAVHPGQIDLRDNPEIAGKLFQLVNIIIEKMVSEPAQINALFDDLPEGQKSQIARRDAETGRNP
jgi:hypothetical protein